MQAPGFTSFIDPNDKIFMNSVNMGTAIEEYMKTSGQKVPPSATGMVRLILESLAFKYRQVLDQLKQICPYPVEKIHIIGGGSRNYLLNQFTAYAAGLTVAAGPYEGTAIGNLIVQAIADGTVSDIKQCRAIIKQSVKVKTFKHRDTVQWNEAYGRIGKPSAGDSGRIRTPLSIPSRPKLPSRSGNQASIPSRSDMTFRVLHSRSR